MQNPSTCVPDFYYPEYCIEYTHNITSCADFSKAKAVDVVNFIENMESVFDHLGKNKVRIGLSS